MQAQAILEQAEINLGYTAIVAPHSCVPLDAVEQGPKAPRSAAYGSMAMSSPVRRATVRA
jgi:hypothetical protein